MTNNAYVDQAQASKLYKIADKLHTWLHGCARQPTNAEGETLTVDHNELAGLLNGIDEDWLYEDLAPRLDQLSAVWNMAKMTGKDELFTETLDAVDALVGLHVELKPFGDGDDLLKHRLRNRLESLEDERQRILSILEAKEADDA